MHLALIVATILSLTGNKSPQRVAFNSIDDGKTHVYVINLDGTGFRQITTSPAEDYDPLWSPDGSSILFTRVPGHRKGEVRSDGHLWTIKPDGTRLRQLTSGPVYDSGEWSADGKQLYFSRQGSKPGSYELNVRTKRIIRSAFQGWFANSSPDGKWIAAVRGEGGYEDDHRADIWLTNSLRKKGQRLTNFKTSLSEPQWSPDGKHIAFKRELPSGANSGDALCILTISSRKLRTIATGHNNGINGARWSPDGKRICFIESKHSDPMTNASFGQLYVISADGTGRRRLTDHWGTDYGPQWTRDGRSILIQGERGMTRVQGGVMGSSTSHVILVDASGKGERILPTDVSSFSPALSP